MSMITQLATSPASSRAQRWRVTASLNVLLSSSSLVTAVTISVRRVMARTRSSRGGRPSPDPARSRGAFAAPRPPWAGPATVTTSSRAPSCMVRTSAVKVASTGPSGPSSLHSTCLAVPVRAAAASWLLTAARDGRSTKAVSARPVA